MALSVGEKAIISDFDKLLRQDMEQEPADKLKGLQCHKLLLVPISIISPDKEDLPVLHLEDTMIADGDPVGVSSQIIKECLSVFKGRLGVDDPFPVVEVT